MATAGVFTLTNADARFDEPLYAYQELIRRLQDVVRQRTRERQEAWARGGREGPPPAPQAPELKDVDASHRLFLHDVYRPFVPVASEYVAVRPQGDSRFLGQGPQTLTFALPATGTFISDLVLHIRLEGVGDPTATAPSTTAPYLRYCAYPGLRLVERVVLRSDRVVIDEYTRDDAVFYMKYAVPVDRRAGWDRCMGQQEVQQSASFANGYTQYTYYGSGAQTPKLAQPALDLLIPLQFWFCRDPSRALFGDLMPATQRTVEVTLAPLGVLLAAAVPGSQSAELVPAALPFDRLRYTPTLYVDTLWVTPDIHAIFASRIRFDLIRVHKQQVSRIVLPQTELLLNQVRFPTEYIMLGARALATAASFDQWYLMGASQDHTDPASRLYVPAYVWNAAVAAPQLVVREALETGTLRNMMAGVNLTVETISMYPPGPPPKFFNAYLPLRYDLNRLITPLDEAVYMFLFCLLPRDLDTSGHLNLSSARNARLLYQLDPEFEPLLDASEWVVSASCLNFLLVRGDHAALVYSI